MTGGVFVAGTGTDVGKTYVAALLVRYYREKGVNAGYFKAALSGAERLPDGSLLPGDAETICRIGGLPDAPEALVPYIFEEAVSPHLAARRKGTLIRREVIAEAFARTARRYDWLVAEGSGGLACPLCDDPAAPLMLTDIVSLLGLPLILVSDAGLGTLNHTVLTAEYAAARGLPVRGVILNRYDGDSFLHRDNRDMIPRLTGLPVLSCVREGQTSLTLADE